MAEVRFRVRWRDAEAQASIDSMQANINALRADVNQLGLAFQSATGPATRFGTAAAAGLTRAEASSRGLLTNVRSLRGAFAGLFVGGGLALAARSFARLNDAATNTESLLRQITDSSQELERSQARIYQLALDLRTPVQAITTLYSRTALALGDAYDPARVEQFTRAIAQLGRATGATEQEFVNATRQLVQGLGSGKLAGDELRGVLEGLPAVGRELARELGVPFGQIRQLGRTGQLTPQTVFGALSGAGVASRAEAAFAEVGLTFGQVFDRFISSLQREFGELEGTGTVLSDLDSTLQNLANNVIPNLTAGIVGFTAAVGPLGSLATLLGIAAAPTAVGALSARRRNIQGASTNVSQLLSGITTSQTRDDIVRLVRSNAVTLGPASSEFATRPLLINRSAFDRFVAEVGATRGRDARTALHRLSTRDFVALQDALRYLDRVGAAGRAGFGRTVARNVPSLAARVGGVLRAGGPPSAGAYLAYEFVTALDKDGSLEKVFSDALPVGFIDIESEFDRAQRLDRAGRAGGLDLDALAIDQALRQGREPDRGIFERELARLNFGLAGPDPDNRFQSFQGAPLFQREINRLLFDAIGLGPERSKYVGRERDRVDSTIAEIERIWGGERQRLLDAIAFRASEDERAGDLFDSFLTGDISSRRNRNDVDFAIDQVIAYGDELERQFEEVQRRGEQAAQDVRNEWLNAFADIGNYARSIFENLFSDSRDLVQVGLDLARIFVRLNVTRERNQGITPSNAAVFARALLGGVPAFHEGRFPSNFNDSREMAAIVRRNETILTPQQLQSVAGAGGGRGNVVNMPIQYVGDFDVRALDLLERRAGTVKAILGLR